MEIKLDYLERALSSLEDILKQPMDEYRRDGAIQRFEYTFELSWKTMQRILKLEGTPTASPKQVLRLAHKAGLIEDLKNWFNFLEKRNLVVHTYNAPIANEVFEDAKKFPKFVKALLKKIIDYERNATP